MRTLALIKVNSIRGALLGVVLLLALMMFFVIGAKPSHAASLEGEYTVTEDFSPGVPGVPTNLKATQFELYKVGDFVVGDPYVALDEAPYTEGVDLPLKADQADKVKWTKEWLECAQTLNNNIMSTSAADRPAVTMIDVGTDGKFREEGLANGLYLLRGESQVVNDYPPKTGQKSYWWPQPMLISILDSDVKVLVKPMTGLVHHLKVVKVWQWPNGLSQAIKDLAALDSITIELYYDGKLKKTVDLPDENNKWYYEWEPVIDENDPSKWSVKEVVKDEDQEEFEKNFEVIVDPKFSQDLEDGSEVLTITNKYDRYNLEIVKTFDAFVDNGEGNSTSLTFELLGYSDDAKENRVYHKFVGLQVDKSKGDKQTLDVKDIPRNLKHLMVKEVDSGNYKPDTAEKEASLDKEKGLYSVSFNNSLDNTTHGSGVINKFKLTNKDPDSPYEFDKRLGKDN